MVKYCERVVSVEKDRQEREVLVDSLLDGYSWLEWSKVILDSCRMFGEWIGVYGRSREAG